MKMQPKELLKVLLFDEAIVEKTKISLRNGFLSLLLVSFVFVIPTEFNITLYAWSKNFITVLALFFVLLFLIFLLCRLLGGTIKFKDFFGKVNFFLGMSLILISVPAFFIASAITHLIKNPTLNLALFSLIPYYTYIFFGWLCKENSKIKGLRAILFALISMTIIFIFHYSLRFITV